MSNPRNTISAVKAQLAHVESVRGRLLDLVQQSKDSRSLKNSDNVISAAVSSEDSSRVKSRQLSRKRMTPECFSEAADMLPYLKQKKLSLQAVKRFNSQKEVNYCNQIQNQRKQSSATQKSFGATQKLRKEEIDLLQHLEKARVQIGFKKTSPKPPNLQALGFQPARDELDAKRDWLRRTSIAYSDLNSDRVSVTFGEIKNNLLDHLRAPYRNPQWERAQSLTYLRNIALGVKQPTPSVSSNHKDSFESSTSNSSISIESV